RAGLVGRDVLRAVGDRQLAGVDRGLDGADVHEGRQHDGLDLGGVDRGQLLAELLDQGQALLPVEIHLPVARHQRLAVAHLVPSSRIAIPGSSLPSISSRLAPPPVEMCEKRSSSKPRLRTAEAESPPPTTVYPWAAARASAMALVPSAKAANSKTPMGPCQKMVEAAQTRAA